MASTPRARSLSISSPPPNQQSTSLTPTLLAFFPRSFPSLCGPRTTPTPTPLSRSFSLPSTSTSQTYIYAAKASLTSLPDELIRNILLEVYTPCRSSLAHAHSHNSVYALPLAGICRKIRHIALGTGELWRDIVLLRPDPMISTEEAFAPQRYILSLTKNHPLNLTLSFAQGLPHSQKEWSEDKINSLFFSPATLSTILSTILLPHFERAESIKLLCDTFAPIRVFVSMTSQMDMRRLRNLELTRCNPYHAEVYGFHPPELAVPLKLFGGSLGKLERLLLDGVHINFSALADSLGETSRLTHFGLRYHAGSVRPSFDELRRILQSASGTLQNLVLEGSGVSSEIPSVSAGLSLPSLHSLSLKFHTLLECSSLVRGLFVPSQSALPALKRLAVADVSREPEFHMGPVPPHALNGIFTSLVPLLTPGQLEELWLTDVDATSDQWVINLAGGAWEGVSTLGMISMKSDLVQALPSLLPRLKDVYAHVVAGTGPWHPFPPSALFPASHPAEAILGALRSRDGGSHAIQRLHLNADEVAMVSEEVLDELSEVVEVRRYRRNLGEWCGGGFAPEGPLVEVEDDVDCLPEEGEEEEEEGISDDEAERMIREAGEYDEADEDVEWNDILAQAQGMLAVPLDAQTQAAEKGEDEVEVEYEETECDTEEEEDPLDSRTGTFISTAPSSIMATNLSREGSVESLCADEGMEEEEL